MNIVFSHRAERNLELIADYLTHKFSISTKEKLINKLAKCLSIIESNPLIYPESEIKKGLRKCVVSRFTTFYYKIEKNEIQLVTIQDTRQNTTFKN